MPPIDWNQLARELNAASGSFTYVACDAIEILIGHDRIRASVDYYVGEAGGPGTELVRGVLRHIRSQIAAQHCYHIYKNDPNPEVRIAAVELMRGIANALANPDVVDWVREFLEDPEPGIQNWGVGVLTELMHGDVIEEKDLETLLRLALKHPSEYVRGKAKLMKRRLRKVDAR